MRPQQTLLLSVIPLVTSQLLNNQAPQHIMSSVSKGSSTSHLTLSDLLGRNQKIQIFSSLLRDVDSVADRLSDRTKSSIVLAPENSALTNLTRKPWENEQDYQNVGANAYDGDEGQDRAERNIRKFVEGHIVDAKEWKEGVRAKTLDGTEVWLEKKGDGLTIQPSGSKVLDVVDKASNGEVYIISDLITEHS